jgi:hypothetical protein
VPERLTSLHAAGAKPHRIDRSFQTDPQARPMDPEDGTASGAVDLVVLAYVAGQAVPLDQAERNAAVRRALLVFAAGGDLHRDPTLDEPAVAELARDLDRPDRRAALLAALDDVEGAEPLNADIDLAWRAYACGLLADELAS